ncbi:MAG TPA: response regulator transcription factor [Thermoanaerobaculia bacterium]|jgi:DNA-binding NarL/FixJ family response regulator|nr:response regulator transcription factor [Thermoanaerobaculia bacterium]
MTPPASLRVLIAEDETLVRQGIRKLLELDSRIEIVAEAGDGEEALRRIGETKPDVVLLDVRMPRLDGLGVLRALQEKPDAPPCLVLTTFDDRSLVLEAIREGAKGFLRKDVSLSQLVGAIEALAAGGTCLQPAVTESLLRGLHARPPLEATSPVLVETLTPRETEVLRLLAAAYTNREIAEALGTAEGTVKIHVSNILGKLGARDRTQAVLRSLEMGLV